MEWKLLYLQHGSVQQSLNDEINLINIPADLNKVDSVFLRRT